MNFPESADLIGRIQENPDFRILEWASLFGFRSLGGGFTFLFALIRNVSNLIKILQMSWNHRLVWVHCDSLEMLDENMWWIK